MKGYHISIAPNSVRIHNTVYYIKTQCNMQEIKAIAAECHVMTYPAHYESGLNTVSTGLILNKDAMLVLVHGLVAARRQKAA